ncbi:MAG TPA: IclR family transcriptional regulator [Nocardioidaceae bacterium]|nr:IclR family transcriptional regulator [Nocardioidaceae bacterium]
MSTNGTQAIDRAGQLLSLVVQADEPISFTDLVEETGLARSTTSRLLTALEAGHLLERDPGGAYISGPLFALYAARHDPWSQVARLADPILQKIGAETGETVNLAVPRAETVVQIAQVNATYMLGARDWMHVTVPPHCSALGKVLYAFDCLPVPGGVLEQLTEHSLAESETLRRELATVRRRGYAMTREELEIGLDAVAAPVHGRDGNVIGALGVSGPSTRLRGQLDEIGRLLRQHSSSLSQVLRRRIPKEGVA